MSYKSIRFKIEDWRLKIFIFHMLIKRAVKWTLACWFRQKCFSWHCNFRVFAELHPKPYGDLPSERGPGGLCPSEVMIQTGRQSGTRWEKTSPSQGLHFVIFCIQEAVNVSWCVHRLPGLLLTLVGSCGVLSLCRGSWAWHPSHTGNRPLARASH